MKTGTTAIVTLLLAAWGRARLAPVSPASAGLTNSPSSRPRGDGFNTPEMLGKAGILYLYRVCREWGQYPVVFETYTTGLVNGVAYWEGHAPGDKASASA